MTVAEEKICKDQYNSSLYIFPYKLYFPTNCKDYKSPHIDPCFASLHCISSKKRRTRQEIRSPENAKRREDAYKVWSDVEKTRVVFVHRETFTAWQGRTYSPWSVRFFWREYINGTEFLLNTYSNLPLLALLKRKRLQLFPLFFARSLILYIL